jgi:hypothetical protein
MSKVWFITGAGSGIGSGTAKAALRSGDHVVATGRNFEKVRNVYPGVAQENIAFVQLDVANEYAELCNPGNLVYLVVQRHQRRARKRWGPHGGDGSTRHHAGRGFRGIVARPSFDCGNVHWKRCFADDRFSCRRRRSSAQRLKA